MCFRLIRGRDYSRFFDVYKDTNGKPFLKNSKKNISITHFDNWTLVVTSNKPIGIDVERMRAVSPLLGEFLGIEAGSKYSFFKEWTRREAFIKKENLKLGDIKTKKTTNRCKTICLYPYVLSICY